MDKYKAEGTKYKFDVDDRRVDAAVKVIKKAQATSIETTFCKNLFVKKSSTVEAELEKAIGNIETAELDPSLIHPELLSEAQNVLRS